MTPEDFVYNIFSANIRQELHPDILQTWRTLVPKPQDREQLTLDNAYSFFFPAVPLLAMAFLVRKRGTRLVRLALLVPTLLLLLRSTFGFVVIDIRYSPYTFIQVACSGICLACIGKALEYGFVHGRFKLADVVDHQQQQHVHKPHVTVKIPTTKYKDPVESRIVRSPSGVVLQYKPLPNGPLASNGAPRTPVRSPSGVTLAFKDFSRPSSPTPPAPPLPITIPTSVSESSLLKSLARPFVVTAKGISDALETICSIRGIGWDWGKGVHVPTDTRPAGRGGFLAMTALYFIGSYLLLDVAESILKIIPGYTPSAGSIFFVDAPPYILKNTFLGPYIHEHPHLSMLIARYTVSTLLSLLVGLGIMSGLNTLYYLETLFFVGILQNNPKNWPPLFDEPWKSESLVDFWSRRWHQILRQTFLVFGGYPLQYIFSTLVHPFTNSRMRRVVGKVGLILGVFLASGCIHGYAIYSCGPGGVDYNAIQFFASQALLVMAERVWTYVTGRPVGGWIGTIWAWCIVLGGIQRTADAWSSRMLASGDLIPGFLSPTRLFVFPVLIKLLSS